MGCDRGCYTVGGPWVDFDPNCPQHGYQAQRDEAERERMHAEQEERQEEQESRLEALEQTIAELKDAIKPKWIKVVDEPPAPGMIVKKFKNGTFWAGYYSGGEKESTFVEYIRLPE